MKITPSNALAARVRKRFRLRVNGILKRSLKTGLAQGTLCSKVPSPSGAASLRFPAQQAGSAHPFFGQARPMRDGQGCWPKPVPMAALRKKVQLGRHARLLKGEIIKKAVLHADKVVLRQDQEGGRGVAGYGQLRRERVSLFLQGEGSRDKSRRRNPAGSWPVRAASTGLVARWSKCAKARRRGGRRRRNPDADALSGRGRHSAAGAAPGPRARWASCSGRQVNAAAVADGHAVFEQAAVTPIGVQPLADLGPFEVQGEDAVSSAGADHHRRARVLFPRGR